MSKKFILPILALALAAQIAAAYEHQPGMVVNVDKYSGSGGTVSAVQKDKLDKMKIKSVRLWLSIFGWDREFKGTAYNLATLITYPGGVDQIKRFKASGYHVVVAVVGDKGLVPQDKYVRADGSILTYDKAVELQLSHLMDRLGLAGKVDVWEIGNEPDQPAYWNDGLAKYSHAKVVNYTDKMLIPAARYLHSRGQKVMTGAPSWNPDNVASIVNRLKATPVSSDDPKVSTAFDLVDFVGYHPYRNIQAFETDIQRAKVAASGKPMIASEWWVVSGGCKNVPLWNEDNAKGYRIVSKYFAYAHHYTLSPDNNTDGASGCNSVLMADNSPRIVAGGRGMFDVLVTESQTKYDVADWDGPGTNVGGGGTGSETAPRPLAAVSGFEIYDDITKTALNHLGATSQSLTIDLKTTPLRDIAFTATLTNGGSAGFDYTFTPEGGVATSTHYDDSASPFAALGDNGATTNAVLNTTPAAVGTYQIKVTPYGGAPGVTPGTAVTYTVVIRDTTQPVPAPVPEPVPAPQPVPVPVPAPLPVDSVVGGNFLLNPAAKVAFCTDVYGISRSVNAIVNIWGCNGGANQQLHFTSNAGSAGAIKLYGDTMCLDSDSAGRMILNKCDATLPTQNFTFNQDSGTVTNGQGKCLDVYGAVYKNGTRIYAWACHGGANQKWTRSPR